MAPLSEEQLRIRKGGIGSSDVAALVGLSSWASPIDVWLRKTGRSQEFSSSVPMRMGVALEPLISELYAERTGAVLEEPSRTFIHPSEPWRLATPDRIVRFDDRHKVLECKNATYGGHEWGEDGTDEIPHAYMCQVQWQLDVIDLEEADVAALLGTKIHIYHVRRDAELCAQLREAAFEFWHAYVLPDIQPPIDGSEGTKSYLARKYPAGNGDLVAANTDDDELAQQLASARDELAAAEERANRLANLMRDRIGDRDGIEGADWKATWRKNKDSRKTDWQAVARELRAPAELIERFTSTKPGARTFRFVGPKGD